MIQRDGIGCYTVAITIPLLLIAIAVLLTFSGIHVSD